VDEVRFPYTLIRNNTIKMAEKMPAEFYSFRPTPESKPSLSASPTLQARTSAPAREFSPTPRAPWPIGGQNQSRTRRGTQRCLRCLRQGFRRHHGQERVRPRQCPPRRPVPPGASTRTRIFTLANIVRHTNEVYGYMCVYLRLKGIVPPSSAPE